MSDERATQTIAMTAPRAVNVNEWLFVSSLDRLSCSVAQASLWNWELFLVTLYTGHTCGAIFVAETDGSLTWRAAALINYFFQRDGREARVFEFCKFTHHFFARRAKEIQSRTR